MSDYEEPIDDETKVSIAAEFMKYAPPGEFNEVYNDVAKLIANDELLRQATSEVRTTFITTSILILLQAVGEYNIQQFTPVELGESGNN